MQSQLYFIKILKKWLPKAVRGDAMHIHGWQNAKYNYNFQMYFRYMNCIILVPDLLDTESAIVAYVELLLRAVNV